MTCSACATTDEQTFTIGVGDTGPLTERLLNKDGTPVDLTTVLTISLVLTPILPSTDPALAMTGQVSGTATLGVVTHNFTALETAAPNAGTYWRRWHLTFSGGGALTVPDDGTGYRTIIAA